MLKIWNSFSPAVSRHTHTSLQCPHRSASSHSSDLLYLSFNLKKENVKNVCPQCFTAASTIDIYQGIVLRFKFNSFFNVLTPSKCFFFFLSVHGMQRNQDIKSLHLPAGVFPLMGSHFQWEFLRHVPITFLKVFWRLELHHEMLTNK